MFETSWKQLKVQLLNGTFPIGKHFPAHSHISDPPDLLVSASKLNPAPPHKILLHTLLCCCWHWRGFLLPVFKHELRSLRFGTVRWERRHSKLVIAALWGFFLQRQQVREWSHRANIMQRSVLKRRRKWRKWWDSFWTQTSCWVWVFFALPSSADYFTLYLSQLHACTVNSLGMSLHSWQTWWKSELTYAHNACQARTCTHTHGLKAPCLHPPCSHVCFVLCRPPFCV